MDNTKLPKKKRVLLIGWDGADWEHIHPIMDAGLMPTFEKLVNGGTIGNLATLQPVLSPMLWNSVATGKFPDKHGIHGFTEPDPVHGGARPYSSTSRKTKAIWNILSQNEFRSNIINWWASYPAEKIKGTVVSNLFHGVKHVTDNQFSISPGTIHPAEDEDFYAQLKMFPNELTQEHILPFIPNAAEIDQSADPRLSGFAKTFSEMMTTHSVATAVMEREPWDFMAIYYTGIDHFSHGFMRYHPPQMKNVSDADFNMYKDVVTSAYRFHDMMLERLLQLAGPDTTVIVCSDHGFQSGGFRPLGTPREPAGPAIWHRQYGILAMHGEGIKKDERIYGASLIDIGPTILNLFGLPIGEDMDGRPLVEAFEGEPRIETIPSWDEVDGEHGMQCDETSITASQSQDLLDQFVALGYIDEQSDDKEKQALSAEIESKYNLARCLIWQQRAEEAIPLLDEILFARPWETRFIIHAADAYFRSGYLLHAKKMLESAFDLKNTITLQAIIIYAKVQLELGEKDAGLKYLELAAERSPRFPELHIQIGNELLQRRKWQLAEAAFRKALRLHGDSAKAYLGLSTIYLHSKEFDKAGKCALNAVGLVHRLPRAHRNLGIALFHSGDLERAAVAFKNALRFEPDSMSYHRWLHRIYESLGDTKNMEYHQDQIFEISPETVVQPANQRAHKHFDLPNFPTEDERAEIVLRERPRQGDVVEKSGKTFVIVSGLPRSGTSLMMQMLEAGGLEPMTDGLRSADMDNPKGYLEWEAIKSIGQQPDLLDSPECEEKAIKAISMLIPHLPKQHDYKIVFMLRPLEEVAASQNAMVKRLHDEQIVLAPSLLEKQLKSHRTQIISHISNAPNMELKSVSYPGVIGDPESTVDALVEFLGTERLPNAEQMSSVVDRSLYRKRGHSPTATTP